jgi:hypothetical protein
MHGSGRGSEVHEGGRGGEHGNFHPRYGGGTHDRRHLEVKETNQFVGEFGQLQTNINSATQEESFNSFSDHNLRQMAEEIVDKEVDIQLEKILDKVLIEDDDVVQKNKSSVNPSKQVLPQALVQWSKRREATADEDSLERVARLVVIKNLETTSKSGNNSQNSILSIPDSVFSLNIKSVGISMGSNE